MNTKTLWTFLVAASLCLGSTAAWAGATYGAREDYAGVDAYGSVTYRAISFSAGQQAMVMVAGDGYSPLLVKVFDQNNLLVDSARCQLLNCVVTWVPKWTGSFYVVVQNEGNVHSEYTMETN